jgi:amino acid transporter
MGIAIVIGTVIGSGVFKKPADVSKQLDEFGLVMMVWVLVGVVALCGSLALAEVGVNFPRAGGNYLYLKEAFGRGAGFMSGWVDFWIIKGASTAALATVFTESLHDVLRQSQGLGTHHQLVSYWGRHAITVGVIVFLALINIRGARLGGGVQLFVTTVKVLSLVAIAVLPFLIIAFVTEPRTVPSASRLTPIWPSSFLEINWSKFGVAMLGAIWAYHGWMNIAPVAEEVRNPNRNIPLSLIGGTLTVMALYLAVNLAYYLVIPGSEMKSIDGRSVAGEYGFRTLGAIGLLLISGAIMVSVFGALNGLVLVTPRLLYAMAEDGLAPNKLAEIHPRYRTPKWAIISLAAWASILVIGAGVVVDFESRNATDAPPTPAGESNQIEESPPPSVVRRSTGDTFDLLTNCAVFGAVSFETLAVATIFVFRRRYPVAKVHLPYRCGFYPWVPLLYVAVMAAVLCNMFMKTPLESLLGLGFIAVGAVVYRVVYHGAPGARFAAPG